MINIETYIPTLIASLQERFGSSLLYVGLQGSYLRGEAHPGSDLDIMVILETLTVSDLDAYRSVIQSMDHYDRSCGFICSKADLAAWNPLEICHLIHGTRDYFGTLSDFVPTYTRQDLQNFVKISVNNLYHELCHRYIHATAEKNVAALPGTYKSVFFILQGLHYLNTGVFSSTKAELLTHLSGLDHAVLERAMLLNHGTSWDFRESFEMLLTWCQETLTSL